MKVKDESYCDFCFCSFGTAEPRKHRNGKVYHLSCFNRMEFQETIVKDITKIEARR